jgi:glyoxylase-like metal-dependent hydrolase (beta-lactamase superfamily II)
VFPATLLVLVAAWGGSTAAAPQAGTGASQGATTAHSPANPSPLLESLRRAHGEFRTPVSVQYGGSYTIEGHLRKPGETASYGVILTLTFRDGTVAWESRMGPSDAPAASLDNRETGVLTADGAFVRQGTTWRPQAPETSAGTAHTLGAVTPVSVLARAVSAESSAPGRVQLADARGEIAVATLDPDTRTITALEWPRAHPRLGDISDTIAYEGFEGRSGILFPKEIVASAHEDGAHYTLRLRILPTPTSPDLDSLEAAAACRPVDPPKAEVRVEAVAPGLWAFIHSEADSRCLVMETADGLMAFEAPVSSAIGEQIVDAIQAKFPGRPLRGIVASHYHPHYTGGIRAFVAAGCDVYATPELEAFIRTLLARPFTRKPDRLARSPREPAFHAIRGRLDWQDAASAVTMIDIGLRSQHTDEYTVFHFPKARVLFQGDLGYAAPNGTLRIFQRGYGLDGALQPHHLDIATLVQSWPANVTPPLEWREFVLAADRAARPDSR